MGGPELDRTREHRGPVHCPPPAASRTAGGGPLCCVPGQPAKHRSLSTPHTWPVTAGASGVQPLTLSLSAGESSQGRSSFGPRYWGPSCQCDEGVASSAQRNRRLCRGWGSRGAWMLVWVGLALPGALTVDGGPHSSPGRGLRSRRLCSCELRPRPGLLSSHSTSQPQVQSTGGRATAEPRSPRPALALSHSSADSQNHPPICLQLPPGGKGRGCTPTGGCSQVGEVGACLVTPWVGAGSGWPCVPLTPAMPSLMWKCLWSLREPRLSHRDIPALPGEHRASSRGSRFRLAARCPIRVPGRLWAGRASLSSPVRQNSSGQVWQRLTFLQGPPGGETDPSQRTPERGQQLPSCLLLEH